jgi:hypothetical protein
MGAALELREDFTGDDLRRLARCSRDAKQVRRLLSLAMIRDGGSRTEAARIGGVGLQIVCDWVVRFNTEGPDGLIDRGGGRSRILAGRGCALAADRPRAVVVGRVPGVGKRGDSRA